MCCSFTTKWRAAITGKLNILKKPQTIEKLNTIKECCIFRNDERLEEILHGPQRTLDQYPIRYKMLAHLKVNPGLYEAYDTPIMSWEPQDLIVSISVNLS